MYFYYLYLVDSLTLFVGTNIQVITCFANVLNKKYIVINKYYTSYSLCGV